MRKKAILVLGVIGAVGIAAFACSSSTPVTSDDAGSDSGTGSSSGSSGSGSSSGTSSGSGSGQQLGRQHRE